MKRILVFVVLFISLLNVVYAGEDNSNMLAEGKNLVDSRIACDKLGDEQLESIGEYYMEQMHPGGAHEAMDAMIGGEGSASLKQMHINMAKQMYCGESNGNGMMSNSMMRGGMMQMMGNNFGNGMMAPFWANTGYYSSSPVWVILSLVLFGLVIYFGYKVIQDNKDKKSIWLLITSIVLLALLNGSGMMGFGIIGLGMVFGMLMMVLFWGAIIWIIFYFFKSISQGSENSQEILKKRYAKGEISKKQFEAMKKELR